MSIFLTSIKSIVIDLKTYLKIKFTYPSLYKNSKIESYIPISTKVGENVKIKANCLITDSLKNIGSGTYIGDGCTIMECSSIGNYCSISHGVKIGLSNHALNHISTNPLFYSKSNGWVDKTTFSDKEIKRTVIEHDVLISANVLIMSGITIGTGSVIGAGAFVNKDVAPYSIVVGSPAKLIKKRFDDDIIESFLESKWWELPKEKLIEKKQYFNQVNAFLDATK